MKTKIKIAALTVLVILFGCNGTPQKQKYTDTPTSGRIAISVDESFKPIMERILNVFQNIYTDAIIDVRYVSESQAMHDLLFDTVRFAVVGRDLNDYEKYVFDTMKITPRKSKIAKDALCFLVNHANRDSDIFLSQIGQIFKGKISRWKQINSKSKLDSIHVVFDQNQSSNVNMLFNLFINDKKFPTNCFAAKSNEEVIEYVKNNKNALGVIGAAWISDANDSTHLRFRNEVRIVALSEDSADFFQPFQAYIATREYPLVRDVFIISKEARSGLGAGLMAFIARDKGQRIILKTGLVPATMPVRLVHINTGE
jgi:phosphate transport system substrate-binding protein